MKQPTIETERLIIRELRVTDLPGMFAMESNPNVHRYLGNKPLKNEAECAEIIQYIRSQYEELGIGRWAMIEKETQKFVGWTGFKFNTEEECGHINFLDLGYRMREEFWGKGYATESAIACMDYIFEHWDHNTIIGMAMEINNASIKILHKKVGMRLTDHFEWENEPCFFYEITKDEWLNRNKTK